MQILLATTNPHKLGEITAVIDDRRIRFRLLLDVDPDGLIEEPVEDQPTFEGNALLKARHYAGRSGLPCLADDSGLEVDALGGAPGVYSARYSGARGGRDVVDPANNRQLLDALGDLPPEARTARFVCVLALVMPDSDDPPQVARGEVSGRILLPAECADPTRPERGRGGHGFGYDPLFELPGDHPRFPRQTTAELTPGQKNSLSHRGAAARVLARHMGWSTRD